MNHELWNSGQYNDKRKKTYYKVGKSQMQCRDLTTRVRAGEMPTLRSRGTKTGHVVQNLRTLLVVFGVMWYPHDAPT